VVATRARTEPVAQRGIGEQRRERVAQRERFARRYQPAALAVLDQIDGSAYRGGHDAEPAGHRFEQRVR
jgi:hypothetical protein